MKNVSVIIPNWNGRELLEKHLPFVLRAKANKVNRISEIIVVDDASTDESVDYLKKTYSGEIRIVKHTKNRGFCSAVNTGARSAGNFYLCLLNTDVSPTENFLASLLRLFKDEKVFGVSLHESGSGPSVGKFEGGFIGYRPGIEGNRVVDSFWISGGSSVVRRDYWMKLGGFDEKLLSPFYWEDLDLCYRAQKRGYRLLWEPKSLVSHMHESTTSKLKKRYVDLIKERNQLLVTWKNITSKALMKRHIEGLAKRVVRHPGYMRVVVTALSRLRLALKAKAKEKRESTVSDEAIFAKFA